MGDLRPAPLGYPIKLVRDNTPSILNGTGKPGDLWYETVPKQDVLRFLRLKLAEEVAEYLIDGGADELSDVYAVVMGLANLHDVDIADLVEADPRGGFLAGVMMYGKHPEFDK